jgi:hypothetical protein
MDDIWAGPINRGLLFLILATATFFRLIYIDQPFVDMFSWRETEDAAIASPCDATPAETAETPGRVALLAALQASVALSTAE